MYVSDTEFYAIETVNNALDKLPESIRKTIKNNWVIQISEEYPTSVYDISAIAGLTFINSKVIWLSPELTESIVIHEVGHAVASGKKLDHSNEFNDLYNTFWNEYSDMSKNEYSAYDTSTPVEFFALLFEQYVCNSENLKEDFVEGYDYMAKITSKSDGSIKTILVNPFIKNYNAVSCVVRKASENISSLYKLSSVNSKVADNPVVEPEEIEDCTSFVGLDEKETVILDDIFDVILNPDSYETKIRDGKQTVTLEYKENVSFSSYKKITACVDFYFGKKTSDSFDIMDYSGQNRCKVFIRIDDAKELGQKRETYLEKVDEVLETIREGTDTEKLLQISKYITSNSKTKTIKKTSVDDFWSHGECNDLTYAMVFRHFCEKLGIQCDIIYGTSALGTNHAWNRVRLSDGSYRYYDLTHYSTGKVDMQQYDKYITLVVNGYV